MVGVCLSVETIKQSSKLKMALPRFILCMCRCGLFLSVGISSIKMIALFFTHVGVCLCSWGYRAICLTSVMCMRICRIITPIQYVAHGAHP